MLDILFYTKCRVCGVLNSKLDAYCKHCGQLIIYQPKDTIDAVTEELKDER